MIVLNDICITIHMEGDELKKDFFLGSLTHVRQFGFEVHTKELLGSRPTLSEDFNFYSETLRLLEKQGFRKWYHHSNTQGHYYSHRTHQFRTCCHEVVFLNTHFFKQ